MDFSRSISPAIDLLTEPVRQLERSGKDTPRISTVDHKFSLPIGQDRREEVGKAENLFQAASRDPKLEPLQESLPEKPGEKNGGNKGLNVRLFPIDNREERWDFPLETLWFLDKGNSSIVPPLRETRVEAAIANSPSISHAKSKFPSLAHDKVQDYIEFFQNQANGFFTRALGRSTAYEDMIKKILREKDLPEELFYLALIESGFNPKAFSRAKASGIWQFVGDTAKRFGLKVDKWVDERRDPEKATYAAARYLKNLYNLFRDWDLAMASYNAGEGRILKAMEKANSQDFWKISQQRAVKKETKEYVPLFLAAVTIAQSPHKYGFQNIEYSPPLIYEKVTVPKSTDLSIIAKAAETELSVIQVLNPALKKGKTPPHSSFEIRVPPGKKESFEKNFPTLSKTTVKSKKHRVRKGENLAKIAQKFQLTLLDLCDMNDLSPKDRVKPGTILLLPPA
jgi:membrane-bound lytic murein transglycosylase D